MEEAIEIVTLLPKDFEKYKTIRLEALKTDPIAFADTFEQASTYDDAYWMDRLKNPDWVWLFARVNSQVVGFMGSHIKENNVPLEAATIHGVYVRKDYRGKGIGKKLMNQLIEGIRKTGLIKKIKLWVAETQLSAQKLYESAGFTFIGKDEELIEYNGKKYEEFIMEKELQ